MECTGKSTVQPWLLHTVPSLQRSTWGSYTWGQADSISKPRLSIKQPSHQTLSLLPFHVAPWRKINDRKKGTGACLCPRQRNNKQLLFNNEKKQKPSFRKRAWHSCTFSRPPDPLERKEDLREDTESQCLFPAMSKRRRNETKQSRRGGRVGKTVVWLHMHKRILTHKRANANTCALARGRVYTQLLLPTEEHIWAEAPAWSRSAGVTNKKAPPCFLY